MKELVQFEKRGFVGLLTLNREEAANALSRQMLVELQSYLQEIRKDAECRVLVVTGAGDKVFCAGADLKERLEMTAEEGKATVALIGRTFEMVEQLPQPVIAMLNGSAFGGGLELALACDLRIGHAGIQVGLTEVSLGIIPGAGGTQRLPRLIGLSKARSMIFRALRIDGKEALNIGILDRVVEQENLEKVAFEVAESIAVQAPLAVQQAKKALNEGMQVSLHTGLQIESLAYEKLFYTEDRLEGLLAFQEKRKPDYKGY